MDKLDSAENARNISKEKLCKPVKNNPKHNLVSGKLPKSDLVSKTVGDNRYLECKGILSDKEPKKVEDSSEISHSLFDSDLLEHRQSQASPQLSEGEQKITLAKDRIFFQSKFGKSNQFEDVSKVIKIVTKPTKLLENDETKNKSATKTYGKDRSRLSNEAYETFGLPDDDDDKYAMPVLQNELDVDMTTKYEVNLIDYDFFKEFWKADSFEGDSVMFTSNEIRFKADYDTTCVKSRSNSGCSSINISPNKNLSITPNRLLSPTPKINLNQTFKTTFESSDSIKLAETSVKNKSILKSPRPTEQNNALKRKEEKLTFNKITSPVKKSSIKPKKHADTTKNNLGSCALFTSTPNTKKTRSSAKAQDLSDKEILDIPNLNVSFHTEDDLFTVEDEDVVFKIHNTNRTSFLNKSHEILVNSKEDGTSVNNSTSNSLKEEEKRLSKEFGLTSELLILLQPINDSSKSEEHKETLKKIDVKKLKKKLNEKVSSRKSSRLSRSHEEIRLENIQQKISYSLEQEPAKISGSKEELQVKSKSDVIFSVEEVKLSSSSTAIPKQEFSQPKTTGRPKGRPRKNPKVESSELIASDSNLNDYYLSTENILKEAVNTYTKETAVKNNLRSKSKEEQSKVHPGIVKENSSPVIIMTPKHSLLNTSKEEHIQKSSKLNNKKQNVLIVAESSNEDATETRVKTTRSTKNEDGLAPKENVPKNKTTNIKGPIQNNLDSKTEESIDNTAKSLDFISPSTKRRSTRSTKIEDTSMQEENNVSMNKEERVELKIKKKEERIVKDVKLMKNKTEIVQTQSNLGTLSKNEQSFDKVGPNTSSYSKERSKKRTQIEDKSMSQENKSLINNEETEKKEIEKNHNSKIEKSIDKAGKSLKEKTVPTLNFSTLHEENVEKILSDSELMSPNAKRRTTRSKKPEDTAMPQEIQKIQDSKMEICAEIPAKSLKKHHDATPIVPTLSTATLSEENVEKTFSDSELMSPKTQRSTRSTKIEDKSTPQETQSIRESKMEKSIDKAAKSSKKKTDVIPIVLTTLNEESAEKRDVSLPESQLMSPKTKRKSTKSTKTEDIPQEKDTEVTGPKKIEKSMDKGKLLKEKTITTPIIPTSIIKSVNEASVAPNPLFDSNFMSPNTKRRSTRSTKIDNALPEENSVPINREDFEKNEDTQKTIDKAIKLKSHVSSMTSNEENVENKVAPLLDSVLVTPKTKKKSIKSAKTEDTSLPQENNDSVTMKEVAELQIQKNELEIVSQTPSLSAAKNRKKKGANLSHSESPNTSRRSTRSTKIENTSMEQEYIDRNVEEESQKKFSSDAEENTKIEKCNAEIGFPKPILNSVSSNENKFLPDFEFSSPNTKRRSTRSTKIDKSITEENKVLINKEEIAHEEIQEGSKTNESTDNLYMENKKLVLAKPAMSSNIDKKVTKMIQPDQISPNNDSVTNEVAELQIQQDQLEIIPQKVQTPTLGSARNKKKKHGNLFNSESPNTSRRSTRSTKIEEQEINIPINKEETVKKEIQKKQDSQTKEIIDKATEIPTSSASEENNKKDVATFPDFEVMSPNTKRKSTRSTKIVDENTSLSQENNLLIREEEILEKKNRKELESKAEKNIDNIVTLNEENVDHTAADKENVDNKVVTPSEQSSTSSTKIQDTLITSVYIVLASLSEDKKEKEELKEKPVSKQEVNVDVLAKNSSYQTPSTRKSKKSLDNSSQERRKSSRFSESTEFSEDNKSPRISKSNEGTDTSDTESLKRNKGAKSLECAENTAVCRKIELPQKTTNESDLSKNLEPVIKTTVVSVNLEILPNSEIMSPNRKRRSTRSTKIEDLSLSQENDLLVHKKEIVDKKNKKDLESKTEKNVDNTAILNEENVDNSDSSNDKTGALNKENVDNKLITNLHNVLSEDKKEKEELKEKPVSKQEENVDVLAKNNPHETPSTRKSKKSSPWERRKSSRFTESTDSSQEKRKSSRFLESTESSEDKRSPRISKSTEETNISNTESLKRNEEEKSLESAENTAVCEKNELLQKTRKDSESELSKSLEPAIKTTEVFVNLETMPDFEMSPNNKRRSARSTKVEDTSLSKENNLLIHGEETVEEKNKKELESKAEKNVDNTGTSNEENIDNTSALNEENVDNKVITPSEQSPASSTKNENTLITSVHSALLSEDKKEKEELKENPVSKQEDTTRDYKKSLENSSQEKRKSSRFTESTDSFQERRKSSKFSESTESSEDKKSPRISKSTEETELNGEARSSESAENTAVCGEQELPQKTTTEPELSKHLEPALKTTPTESTSDVSQQTLVISELSKNLDSPRKSQLSKNTDLSKNIQSPQKSILIRNTPKVTKEFDLSKNLESPKKSTDPSNLLNKEDVSLKNVENALDSGKISVSQTTPKISIEASVNLKQNQNEPTKNTLDSAKMDVSQKITDNSALIKTPRKTKLGSDAYLLKENPIPCWTSIEENVKIRSFARYCLAELNKAKNTDNFKFDWNKGKPSSAEKYKKRPVKLTKSKSEIWNGCENEDCFQKMINKRKITKSISAINKQNKKYSNPTERIRPKSVMAKTIVLEKNPQVQRPKSAMDKRKTNFFEDDSDSDSVDSVPISQRMRRKSMSGVNRVRRKMNFEDDNDDSSDSCDSVPIIQRLRTKSMSAVEILRTREHKSPSKTSKKSSIVGNKQQIHDFLIDNQSKPSLVEISVSKEELKTPNTILKKTYYPNPKDVAGRQDVTDSENESELQEILSSKKKKEDFVVKSLRSRSVMRVVSDEEDSESELLEYQRARPKTSLGNTSIEEENTVNTRFLRSKSVMQQVTDFEENTEKMLNKDVCTEKEIPTTPKKDSKLELSPKKDETNSPRSSKFENNVTKKMVRPKSSIAELYSQNFEAHMTEMGLTKPSTPKPVDSSSQCNNSVLAEDGNLHTTKSTNKKEENEVLIPENVGNEPVSPKSAQEEGTLVHPQTKTQLGITSLKEKLTEKKKIVELSKEETELQKDLPPKFLTTRRKTLRNNKNESDTICFDKKDDITKEKDVSININEDSNDLQTNEEIPSTSHNITQRRKSSRIKKEECSNNSVISFKDEAENDDLQIVRSRKKSLRLNNEEAIQIIEDISIDEFKNNVVKKSLNSSRTRNSSGRYASIISVGSDSETDFIEKLTEEIINRENSEKTRRRSVRTKQKETVHDDVSLKSEVVVKVEEEEELGRAEVKKEFGSDDEPLSIVAKRLSAGQENETESEYMNLDIINIKKETYTYELGDTIWSKIGSHPYWPSVVVEDPGNENQTFTKSVTNRGNKTMYHVRFFGDNGRRGWVMEILPYYTKDDLNIIASKLKAEHKTKKAQSHIRKTYVVPTSILPKWNAAVDEAEILKSKTYEEKMKFFEKQYLNRQRQRLKDAEAHLDEDHRSVKSEPVAISGVKRKRNAEKERIIVEEVTPSSKRRKVVEKEDSQEIENIKRSRRSEVGIGNDVVKEEPQEAETTKKSRKSEVGISKAVEVQETPDDKENEGETSRKLRQSKIVPDEMKMTEEIAFEMQSSLYKRNNIFKGLSKERVCFYCFKRGELFRCKGKCHCSYHTQCGGLVVVENPSKLLSRDNATPEKNRTGSEISTPPERSFTFEVVRAPTRTSGRISAYRNQEPSTSSRRESEVIETQSVSDESLVSQKILELNSETISDPAGSDSQRTSSSSASSDSQKTSGSSESLDSQKTSSSSESLDSQKTSSSEAQMTSGICSDFQESSESGSDFQRANSEASSGITSDYQGITESPEIATDVSDEKNPSEISPEATSEENSNLIENTEENSEKTVSNTDQENIVEEQSSTNQSEESSSQIIPSEAPVTQRKPQINIVEIVTIKSKLFNTPPRKAFPAGFSELSLVEKIDFKMKEIMDKFENKSTYFESSTTDSSCDEVRTEPSIDEPFIEDTSQEILEDEIPLRNAPKPDNSKKIVHVTAESVLEEAEIFKCGFCINDTDPYCFVCHHYVSPKGSSIRQKCSLSYCGRFYHLECLKLWPQTQYMLTQTKLKDSDINVDTFVCPMHSCHTCTSEDPRAAYMKRCNSDKLAKCMYCPATYHCRNYCVPAGTEIFTTTQIICPRHCPSKRSHTINTTWCFICSEGGDLICCENCPTSVHQECLPMDLDKKEVFICEDCESGRLPLYDEIVWCKLGHYRWWPGLILFPNEIPVNVMKIKHYRGEFVVKFYGTYDHYWVSRGRTFLFQEGDQGQNQSSIKNKLDSNFEKAIEEAAESHKHKKAFKCNREASDKNDNRPPPYVKIFKNKPVGNVRQFDPNLSNTTACDCNPSKPNPCGPDSDCLNRLLMTECNPEVCPAGKKCQNQSFEKREYPLLTPFKTEGRGWGLHTLAPIRKGQFVIEYVGELIDDSEYQRRIRRMHECMEENYYFLTIDKDRMLDAGPKGNVSRFMNHSCDPNCETQKWTVSGDTRVGLFANKNIPANTELTFNYNLECVGKEKKVCRCGASNCSGFIGVKAKQDESKPKKSRKNKYKKKKRETDEVNKSPCFICRKRGDVQNCNNKTCNKSYHLKCLNLESWPDGNKFMCPWHNCNVCSKRTIRCCVKCMNSFCPQHSEGKVRHHPMLGFICFNHDPEKHPNLLLKGRNRRKWVSPEASSDTEESSLVSATSDDEFTLKTYKKRAKTKKSKNLSATVSETDSSDKIFTNRKRQRSPSLSARSSKRSKGHE